MDTVYPKGKGYNGTITSNVSGNTTSTNLTNLTNNGTLQATDGAGFTFNTANRPVNTGVVRVGVGGTITLNAGMSQTGAASETNVNGTLSVAAGQTLALQGGLLDGAGTITGAVNNAGGILSPGNSPGRLTENGNYTQGAGGFMRIELGGTTAGLYDVFDVNGTAALAGTLQVSLFGGFAPMVGQTFTFLEYDGRTGAFTSPVSSLDAGYGYDVTYNATNAFLTVTSVAVVPEPGTLTLVGAGFVLGGAFRRRRQTRAGIPRRRSAA